MESEDFFGDVSGFVSGVAAGEVVPTAAAIGIASLLIIIAVKMWLGAEGGLTAWAKCCA